MLRFVLENDLESKEVDYDLLLRCACLGGQLDAVKFINDYFKFPVIQVFDPDRLYELNSRCMFGSDILSNGYYDIMDYLVEHKLLNPTDRRYEFSSRIQGDINAWKYLLESKYDFQIAGDYIIHSIGDWINSGNIDNINYIFNKPEICDQYLLRCASLLSYDQNNKILLMDRYNYLFIYACRLKSPLRMFEYLYDRQKKNNYTIQSDIYSHIIFHNIGDNLETLGYVIEQQHNTDLKIDMSIISDKMLQQLNPKFEYYQLYDKCIKPVSLSCYNLIMRMRDEHNNIIKPNMIKGLIIPKDLISDIIKYY